MVGMVLQIMNKTACFVHAGEPCHPNCEGGMGGMEMAVSCHPCHPCHLFCILNVSRFVIFSNSFPTALIALGIGKAILF